MDIPLKRILKGILLAPLTTLISCVLWFTLYGLVGGDILKGFQFGMFVGLIGTVIFGYPGTIILCLSLIKIFKNNPAQLSWQLFVYSAMFVTALIANVELLEDGFGPAYMLSAISCSFTFWYIAIKGTKISKGALVGKV